MTSKKELNFIGYRVHTGSLKTSPSLLAMLKSFPLRSRGEGCPIGQGEVPNTSAFRREGIRTYAPSAVKPGFFVRIWLRNRRFLVETGFLCVRLVEKEF
ncbi:MAG: hypothetical protein KME30_21200 [Iphinoe sp. HA4291-MV1]|nr:hypothetical protein [Iphinoe sp. HA4291-MV1]